MSKKLLFTPGPLSVEDSTRMAMLTDYGSRDAAFIEHVAAVRGKVVAALGLNAAEYTCVPMQGAGTYAVESVIGTIRPSEKLLVLVNGAYGRRMVDIARRLGIPVEAREYPEDHAVALDPSSVPDDVTHIAMVHHETTAGVLSPVAVVKGLGRVTIVDAMSSMGGIAEDFTGIDYIVGGSGKCFEGVPGLGLVVVRLAELQRLQWPGASH